MNTEPVPSTGGVAPPSGTTPHTVAYYDRHGILVTNRHFCVGGYRYEVAALTQVRTARGSRHPGATAALVTAATEAVFVAPFATVIGAGTGLLLATVALSVPCGVGLYCACRWPAHFALLATYRGHPVTLYLTRDEREFGRISRALRRAIEAADHHA